MKFSKIPDTCRSSHMKKVDEKLNYLKMPFEAHRDYLNYSKAVCDNRISVETIDEMCKNAKTEGFKEGAIKKSREVAINMLEENMNVGLIAEITELSLEHIESLKSSLSKAK